MRNTFRTYERLKREQHIDTLFRNGKAFSVLQVRFVYLLVPRGAELSPVRAGFSVPKKKFRKSVQRHRLRRLMVEAWRLNKPAIYDTVPEDRQLHLFILYIAPEAAEFSTLQQSIQTGIARLAAELGKQGA